MNILKCCHQLSKHFQHLLPCQRLFFHIFPQRDAVCIFHQDHDIQAHELFALFDQFVNTRSAIAVWVIFFTAVNVITFWIIVPIIIGFLDLSSLFKSYLKFFVKIVWKGQKWIIFIALLNAISDTCKPSMRLAQLLDYFLNSFTIRFFSLNPATFVPYDVLVLKFAYRLDLLHSWVIMDRSFSFWVKFYVHFYCF